MADPTQIVPYAKQRSTNLKSALDAARNQLAAAQAGITAESAKLQNATTAFAGLEEKIKTIRQKLAAIPTPADGDLLLLQLEQAIIDSRSKHAEILSAQTNLVAAQAAADLAESEVAAFSAQLASADALVKQAEPASAQRDALIAALAGPLATIKTDAGKAIDETKPTGANFKKAKKRLDDDIPAPLLARAKERRAAEAARQANTTAERQAAEAAVSLERDTNGGLAGRAVSSWGAFVQLEDAARSFVNTARSRFDQASAKLAQVADRNNAPLTAEQVARLNAPDPLLTKRGDAAAEEKDVAAKRTDLESKQKDLDAAILDAKANPKDAAKQAAVGTAQGKVNTAKQDLATAQGHYETANEAIMNDWEAAVPDTTWSLFNDYEDAVATLTAMPDPAALSTLLANAETTYVQAQLLADASADILVGLTTEQAQRAAREESAQQNSAASLFSALRGDN